MNPRIKRLLSMFLALTMVFSLLPVSASAASTTRLPSNTVEIEVGETATLKVSGIYSKTTWTSSDDAIATVSSDGAVTGIAPGTATITATSKGFGFWGKTTTTKFTVIVTEPENREKVTVKVGEIYQLSIASSGGSVTWKSSDNNIASVDANGLVTGVSEGDVIITATEKKVTGNPFFWWGGGRKTVITTTEFEVTVLPGDEQPSEPEESESPVATYTVTFESNGGTAVESQVIAEGETVTEPEAPTMEGYTFAGWYTDAELTTAYDFATPVTSDITLYAAWEEEIDYYTVTFESNGGTAVESQVIAEGETVTEPEAPTMESSIFAGWYTDVELTTAYDFATPVTSDITLYAAWEEEIVSRLSISIGQSDSTVTSIHQALNGTFSIENAVLDEINCTAVSENYPENKYEIGKLLIDESDGTWTLTDIRLYPGRNEITLTITDIEGNQANSSISVTYDSGTLSNYDDSEIVYFDDGSGTGYVNDVILIVIDASLSAADRDFALQEICNITNGSVIGQLNGSKMYQIRISASDYEELLTICDDISNINGVTANCDYIIPSPDNEVEPADEEEGTSASIQDTEATVMAAEAGVIATSNSMIIPDDPWQDVFQGSLGQNWNEDDPSGLNWWVEAVKAPSAWSYSDKMNKITIGIVDTGIDTGHKDLSISRTLTSNVAANHGTHVAGIIGATANNDEGITGMVWNKKLYGYDAYQGAESTSKIIEGVEALLTAGAKVINDSNGAKLDNNQIASTGRYVASIVNNWVNTITDNFIIVQAAGNDNVDSRRAGTFASVTDSDALEHIIIVAATQKPSNGSYKLTDFSNYGSGVTVAAPGQSIFSSIVTGGLDGDYGKMSGTSMAAPIVTGVAAMVWSIDPNFTAAEVKEIIVNTATTAVSGYNDSGTYYIVNACAAVEEAIARTYDDGTAEGYFVDATTGAGLQIGFRIHKGSADGEIVYSGTSGSDGYFWFEVPAGDYVVEAYGDEFISSYTACTVEPRCCKILGDIPISTEVDENTYRIVLEWGATPSDLDSHLVANTLDDSAIHVFYSQMTFDEANLDIDDVSSYGPETITVTGMENLDGFTYSVHNFSDLNASSGDDAAYYLAQSGAIVKVYKANTLIATYEIPTNRAGTVWNVFSIDRNGNISTINSFEYISDPSSVGSSYVSYAIVQTSATVETVGSKK